MFTVVTCSELPGFLAISLATQKIIIKKKTLSFKMNLIMGTLNLEIWAELEQKSAGFFFFLSLQDSTPAPIERGSSTHIELTVLTTHYLRFIPITNTEQCNAYVQKNKVMLKMCVFLCFPRLVTLVKVISVFAVMLSSYIMCHFDMWNTDKGTMNCTKKKVFSKKCVA